MKRREFIAGLGSAAVWPVLARAQQRERTRHIGILYSRYESDSEVQARLSAFRQRLQQLGWSEGSNIRSDLRFADGDLNRLRVYAAELANLKPDVILAESTPAVAALRDATHTIPIVFVNAQNPVGGGYVRSLARPGGNITGFVAFEPAMGGKWLGILKELAPSVVRIALLYNPRTRSGQYFESIDVAAHAMSLSVIRSPFLGATDIEGAIGDLARGPNGGVLVLPDTSTNLHRELIVNLVARYQLPAVYPFRDFIVSGGLAYYGTNGPNQYRQAAGYVDRILNGENPADPPRCRHQSRTSL
jgi:putative ABC transport system substrate-binding protein